MEIPNTLAKNTLFSLISFGARFLLLSIVVFRIARVVGVESFGVFTFSQSFTALFVILADFGLSTYVTREVAQKNPFVLTNFGTILKMKALLSLLTLLFVHSSTSLIGYQETIAQTVFYLMVAVVFDNFINLVICYYRGLERFQFEALITAYNSLILFGLVMFVLHDFDGEIVLVAQAYALSRLLALVLTGFVARDLFRTGRGVAWACMPGLLKQASPYAIQILFGVIYFQIDTVMLKHLRNSYEVGIYQAAMRLVVVGLIFVEIIQNAFFPTVSRLYKESFDNMKRVMVKMNKYLITIGLSLTVILFTSASSLISFVYGPAYEASGSLLALLSLLLVIRFAATTFGVVLTAAGKQNQRMAATMTASFFNIVLNYFLIPRYGFMGAAIATLLTNVLVFSILLTYSLRIVPSLFLDKKAVNIVLMCTSLALVGLGLREQSIFLVGGVLALFFLVASYFMVLEDHERELIAEYLAKVMR
ncbi:MAG: flippase [bacterium]